MTKRQKKDLARILLGAALFSAAALLPLEGTARLLAFLVPYLFLGYDVFWAALRNLAGGQFLDENFLMSLATVGAMLAGEYPEGVAVMLFYQVGELFQRCAVDKSRRSISQLMDIRPDSANVVRDGQILKVNPEGVAVGETILVRPGERVPLDGTVSDGQTTLNTAALTGESLPADAGPGDAVISGSVNLSRVIRVSVRSVYGESTVARILDLVENAASKKARVEAFITRFARYYTPAVVGCAALLALVPPLALGLPWSEWVHRALIFLVVSCPCALVISVPLSFFGGIGGASRQGILVKGSSYLEALSRTRTVVFDKTGTLTEGSFTVSAVHPEVVSEAQLLEYAACAETYSNHPISLSIRRAHGREIPTGTVTDAEDLAGLGVRAVVNGHMIYAGNSALMDSVGAGWHGCHRVGTIIHVAVDGAYMGHIVISDTIKPDARQAIDRLRAMGVVRLVMLTGDREAVGRDVGDRLGLDQVHAQLMPGDKVSAVERLLGEQKEGETLAFVGDGINDAPVLSRADIGIAMGALGSDAAIEAADLVLMDDKPSKLADALLIARRTMAIVHQNIVFALAVKVAVLVLGALGIADMWLAVFADVGVSVLAILNAMRAMRIKGKDGIQQSSPVR
ncbi:MAG: cadmium-translocating P-type ATPase [Intestinimonas sp.]|jgi:Cd2+/Zn2+-exporting ATPase|nr:cadmium-translocating P-type ATPase [Intestinimonas sp.]